MALEAMALLPHFPTSVNGPATFVPEGLTSNLFVTLFTKENWSERESVRARARVTQQPINRRPFRAGMSERPGRGKAWVGSTSGGRNTLAPPG